MTEPAAVQPTPKKEAVFSVLVAKVSSADEAETLVEKLEKAGLTSLSTVAINEEFHVRFGHFSSAVEAQAGQVKVEELNLGTVTEIVSP